MGLRGVATSLLLSLIIANILSNVAGAGMSSQGGSGSQSGGPSSSGQGAGQGQTGGSSSSGQGAGQGQGGSSSSGQGAGQGQTGGSSSSGQGAGQGQTGGSSSSGQGAGQGQGGSSSSVQGAGQGQTGGSSSSGQGAGQGQGGSSSSGQGSGQWQTGGLSSSGQGVGQGQGGSSSSGQGAGQGQGGGSTSSGQGAGQGGSSVSGQGAGQGQAGGSSSSGQGAGQGQGSSSSSGQGAGQGQTGGSSNSGQGAGQGQTGGSSSSEQGSGQGQGGGSSDTSSSSDSHSTGTGRGSADSSDHSTGGGSSGGGGDKRGGTGIDDDNCFPFDIDFNCDPNYRYREIEGNCNNLQNPWWGRISRPLLREQTPSYAGGWDNSRLAVSGNPLPNPRNVSNTLFKDNSADPDPVATVTDLFMGSFITHDVTHTVITRPVGGNPPDCGEDQCNREASPKEGDEEYGCEPIPLDNDPYITDKDCLRFVRSQYARDEDCRSAYDYRQQLNMVTSALDLSITYGHKDYAYDKLREGTDPNRGKLAVIPNPQDSNLEPYMPQSSKGCDPTHGRCFVSGDGRVNMAPTLTAIHLVFHRYHNVIEEHLHNINPHWSGEKLLEESRHINIAIFQNIVYQEYVPMLVGPETMDRFGLHIAKSGPVQSYDPNVNPETTNVFATAAQRFGHSQITDQVGMSNYDFEEKESLFLTEGMYKTTIWYGDNYPAKSCPDSLLLYMMSQSAERMDGAHSDMIRNHYLTEHPPFGEGADLSTTHINRGRDHGIKGYPSWRRWCNLTDGAGFEGLSDIPADKQQSLKDLYEDPEDIDVYVAGLLETPVPGGIVGPLFSCLIGHQFMRFKVGDRYWFENDDPVTGFTEGQRETIRKQTFARLHCDTMDEVDSIQKWILKRPGQEVMDSLEGTDDWENKYKLFYLDDMNPRGPCSDLDALDLSQWAERPSASADRSNSRADTSDTRSDTSNARAATPDNRAERTNTRE